jgi:hypothetical protein
MRLSRAMTAALALAALAFADARADDAASRELEQLYDTVARLERRIVELEGTKTSTAPHVSVGPHAGEWAERVRLSGSAAIAQLDGGQDGLYENGTAQVWDARFFIDADLASDVEMAGATLFRDAGFSFEWNLVRLGSEANEVGNMHVSLRGLGGAEWANLEFGRFQLPFGENYLRFSKGYWSDPFIALSAPPPWFWDEGVKLWGKFANGKLGYVASLTDGEGGFNTEKNGSKQLTLKLSYDPAEWLHVSASALRSGKLGSAGSPAVGSLWLGEMFPTAMGLWTSVPIWDHGAEIADGPNELSDVNVLGGDVIFRSSDARLWLSGGKTWIDSKGPRVYDRDVFYWLAELTYQLRGLSPLLAPMYVAVRANGLGTYDEDEGYLLDFRYGDTVGFNMRALDAYALALGLPVGDHVVMKVQYVIQNIELVRGVTDPDVRDAAEHGDFLGVEVGVHF